MNLGHGQPDGGVCVPPRRHVLHELCADAAPPQVGPDGQVRQQQDPLMRVDLPHDASEYGTVTPDCDRGEHLRVALSAETAGERCGVLELVGGERDREHVTVETVEEFVVEAVQVAKRNYLRRARAHRDFR